MARQGRFDRGLTRLLDGIEAEFANPQIAPPRDESGGRTHPAVDLSHAMARTRVDHRVTYAETTGRPRFGRGCNEGRPRPGAGVLAELARRQHGVVSIRQLEAAPGLFAAVGVKRLVEAGRLHRVHRGVYAVGHTDLSRAWGMPGGSSGGRTGGAAQLLLGGMAVGALVGVAEADPRHRVRAAAPSGRRRGSRHRARNLVEDDRALVDGIPVTSVARTLLDLAWKLRGDQLGRVAGAGRRPRAARPRRDPRRDRAQSRPPRREAAPARARHLRAADLDAARSSSGASSSISSAPACRVRHRLERGRLRARRLLARAPLRQSNSTPSRPTATATPSRATTTATSTSRLPGSRRSASANVQFRREPDAIAGNVATLLAARAVDLTGAPSAVDSTGAMEERTTALVGRLEGRPRCGRRCRSPGLSAGRCRGAWRP